MIKIFEETEKYWWNVGNIEKQNSEKCFFGVKPSYSSKAREISANRVRIVGKKAPQ